MTLNRLSQVERSCHVVALVEDDDSVRTVLARLVAALGYRVEAFRSAETFLGAEPPPPIPDHGNGNNSGWWSCLLSDVHLPGMSGLALARHLRAMPTRLALVPILLMSGSDHPTLRQEAIKVGAVLFLPKPLDKDVLAEALERAIETRNEKQ
jgi:FixJ family two-component response regulator